MSNLKLHYFFDPLCGWCYASAPAVAGLAHAHPQAVELMPSGLFSDAGARDLSPEWVTHAWSNDQRIEQLTGQRFSEAYHHQVLLGAGVRFDSGPANLALTAMRALAPRLEPVYLHAMQIQRYVLGLDTARPEVLGRIAADVAAKAGTLIDADRFSARLTDDFELARETAERIPATQGIMRRLGTSGIPQLLVRVGDRQQVLSGPVLYGGAQVLLNAVDELRQRAVTNVEEQTQ